MYFINYLPVWAAMKGKSGKVWIFRNRTLRWQQQHDGDVATSAVWWSCLPKSPVPFLHRLVLKIRIAIFFYNSHSCLLFLKVMWLKALKVS